VKIYKWNLRLGPFKIISDRRFPRIELEDLPSHGGKGSSKRIEEKVLWVGGFSCHHLPWDLGESRDDFPMFE